MTPEQLKAFEKRAEGWRKNGTVREHRMDGVDIDAIHRHTKYGNQKTTADGITFDSKREAGRWQELRLLEQAGEIKELGRQRKFFLEVNGQRICAYISDFDYLKEGKLVVEDVKGVRTREYIIKKKLMKAIHKIDVLET